MLNLLYFIIILVFSSVYISSIIAYVVKCYVGGPSTEYAEKRNYVASIIAELSQISMADEFAKYAKLQRKINKEKAELARLSSEKSERVSKISVSLTLILRAALGLLITLTVLMNRSVVVAQLPPTWLWPLHNILCWSRDIPGGITAPCWVIICTSVAKSLSNFKFKKIQQ